MSDSRFVLPSDEEVVQLRVKKDRWYRAVLVDDPVSSPFGPNGLLNLPEKYRPRGLFVKLSHNLLSFTPAGTRHRFRLLSTNLTAENRKGERLPVAVSSGDVVLREECSSEPPLEHVGILDAPFGGVIHGPEDLSMLPESHRKK